MTVPAIARPGELIGLTGNGRPQDVFAINAPLKDGSGLTLEKRDRLSYAILQKVAAEYRGEFFDKRLTVNLGVGAPFFRRNLTNYCATSSAGGFVECGSAANVTGFLTGTPTQTVVASAAAASGATCTTAATPVCTFPTQGPQQRIFNYKKILPTAGFTFQVYDKTDVYGSYSKNIQVPGTDNLYNSFYFPAASEKAQPKPEESDNFDLGLRYRSSKLQWQIGGWYTLYTNRLASSYDPDLDKSVYRNLGKVTKYGWDATLAYQPIRQLSVYAFGSYLHSKIENDVEAFRTTAAGPLGPIGTIVYAPTAGKRESNAPVYTFGGGATVDVNPVSVGIDVKRTGPRYIYDTNETIKQAVTVNGAVQTFDIYSNKAPAYWSVDLNARVGFEWAGLNKNTYFQFNVRNLFQQLLGWLDQLGQRLSEPGPDLQLGRCDHGLRFAAEHADRLWPHGHRIVHHRLLIAPATKRGKAAVPHPRGGGFLMRPAGWPLLPACRVAAVPLRAGQSARRIRAARSHIRGRTPPDHMWRRIPRTRRNAGCRETPRARHDPFRDSGSNNSPGRRRGGRRSNALPRLRRAARSRRRRPGDYSCPACRRCRGAAPS